MYFQLIQKPNLIGSYVRVDLYLTETCVKQQYFHLSVFRFSSFEALVLSNWVDGVRMILIDKQKYHGTYCNKTDKSSNENLY